MPNTSVIVPCYNHGKYLDETIQSILKQSYQDFEIIIVNDGSTDPDTLRLLNEAKYPSTRILHTENQGLAAARNNGISIARGEYILPLDADDIIDCRYLELGVSILDKREEIGIVYCRAQLFGAVDTEWLLPPYSLKQMLRDNIIFCSALFRKCDWEKVNGYYPGMTYGWEDYDFWLSLIELGREVYQIPEKLFFYRVKSDSMVRSKTKAQKVQMFKRIYGRHEKLFSENIDVWIDAMLEAGEQYFTSKLYLDNGNGIEEENSISRKVELGTGQIDFDIEGFAELKAIRFDPVDTPAVVKIDKLAIIYKDKKEYELAGYTSNALFEEEEVLFFNTNDPQIHFSLPSTLLQGAVRFRVKLQFLFLDKLALQEIVSQQQQLLKEIDEEFSAAKNLGTVLAIQRSLRPLKQEGILDYLKRQVKP